MSDERPEFAFINWIARQSGSRTEVQLGIGDDAAVLSSGGKDWVVTKDVITAGVHFDAKTPLALVGRKALAVNISDLAAMAAQPCAAFIGIVLPKSMTRSAAEELYRGLQQLASEWDICIGGGDTNSWDGPLVVSVTLLGLVESGQAVRRDGAQPDDWIFVTGPLGGSLESGRHLTFTPRIREAETLKQAVTLHAMLDLSDGLGSDLFHLLDRSGVGAILNADSIPIHPDVSKTLPSAARLQHALSDGEDFELLFTVSAADGQRLIERPPPGVELFRIGEITAAPGASLVVDGEEQTLPRSGWSHGFGQTAID
ncbi:thiamine-phosphate kinase [Planctomicrobium piriforme]|uniref:Thiamine-monophosphate kinase n=1 Tax=Planctomicrobium piriforme TaxID=1576369 RepID=A0A1I3DCN8_9PLAN|nr:thiamine-phosphate kinase [Planctomicrobium piriforme]SFH84241.1 thiamine-monophosphate kinase [Planctomicrobium piriforme]